MYLGILCVLNNLFHYVLGLYKWDECDLQYKHKRNLVKHKNYECGKERHFQCPQCPYKAKQKVHLKKHFFTQHMETNDYL